MSVKVAVKSILWLIVFALALYALWVRTVHGQTTVPPIQVRTRVEVIEWAKCQGTGTGTATKPDGTTYTYTWDCNKVELIKLRMPDGSTRGPYLTVPPPAEFVQDSKWFPVPIP